MKHMTRFALALAFLASAGLGACGGEQPPIEHNYPEKRDGGNIYVPNPKGERDSLLGSGCLNFGGKQKDDLGGGGGIGVNGFLWRASLDTLAFVPLSSADPFCGVIITDWYTPPDVPDERFKLTIYILDRRLRADGLKVAVFKQKQAQAGAWIDTPINPQTATNLENAILVRARQLRLTQPTTP